MGEPGEQVRPDDRDVADDRGCAIENMPHHAQGPGRIALRKTDHRAAITDLTELARSPRRGTGRIL
jgi:hypothetical protein